jgi:hypothetical protein
MEIEPIEPPKNYPALLAELKQRIGGARLRAALAVNRELVQLYWSIGRDILARQNSEGWGTKVIDRLAIDLHQAFPEMTGLSARNLKYMRAFAEAWPDQEIVQQLVAQLPWAITSAFLMLLNRTSSANGMLAKRSRMARAATSLPTRSRVTCSLGKVARSPISHAHCRPSNPSLRSRSSKTRIASIFFRSARTCSSGIWSAALSSTPISHP